MADPLQLESTTDHYLLEDGSGVLRQEDPPSYYDVVRADNPVAYWRFGEGSGTVAADSVGTNPGTYTGGYTLGQTGALTGDPDAAVKLNGTTGYVAVAQGAALDLGNGPFSLELWYKPPSGGESTDVYLLDKATTNAYQIWVNSGGAGHYPALAFGGSAGDIIQTQVALTDNAHWYHIVFTKNGVISQGYVDAVAGSIAGVDKTTVIGNSVGDLVIGAKRDKASGFSSGTIDEVALYNVVLTSTQVATHYAARAVNRLVSYVNPMPAFIAQ